jgi:hypothetical protein
LNTEKRDLRSRIIAAIWVIAKGAGMDSDRVHEIGSATLGRALVDGFGMTTCDSRELGRWLEATKVAAGVPPARGQRSATRGQRSDDRGQRSEVRDQKRPRAQKPLRADGQARASLEQYRLMHALEEELHLSPEEFAGVARRATGKEHSSASKDIQKVIEGLKAIRARRQRSAVSSQRSELISDHCSLTSESREVTSDL